MFAYFIRRLGSAAPTLFALVTLSFFLLRLAPGGPFDLEQVFDANLKENLSRIYEQDRPLIEQYGLYLSALARGDFGPAYSQRDFTIAELFAKSLPISICLGLSALILALAVGGSMGVVAALRHNRAADHAAIGVATFAITVPNFVAAPALQLVFGLWLAWLPVGGWNDGGVRNAILPVVALALPQIAVIARLSRAAMIETLRANHIRTLSAYGLPLHVILRHALRAAALPVVSYLGPAAAALLTGSVVVETIFSIPGVGRYFVAGALDRDYTLVMATVVLIAVLVLAFNLGVDVLYALLDPRMRED